MDNPKPTSSATLFDIIAVRNANQGALATISKHKHENSIEVLLRKTSARIKLILHRYFFSSSKYTRDYFSYQDFYGIQNGVRGHGRYQHTSSSGQHPTSGKRATSARFGRRISIEDRGG